MNDFVWTNEITQEFSKIVLDNYHCVDSIENAQLEFIKTKIKNFNGKRIRPKPSSFVWEVRNN